MTSSTVSRTVRPKIVDERGALGHLVFLDPEILDNDFFTRSAMSLMLSFLLLVRGRFALLCRSFCPLVGG